jgi:hypothetical protein
MTAPRANRKRAAVGVANIGGRIFGAIPARRRNVADG